MSAIILIYLIVPVFIFGLLAAALLLVSQSLKPHFLRPVNLSRYKACGCTSSCLASRSSARRGAGRRAYSWRQWQLGRHAARPWREARLSHRVILIDRPGHGWSARPDCDDYASPARQAEFVAGAFEQLGVRRAILLGHSWGGAFATAYAFAFPKRTAGSRAILGRLPIPGQAIPVGTTSSRCCLISVRCSCAPAFCPLGLFTGRGASRSRVRAASVPDGYHAPRRHSFWCCVRRRSTPTRATSHCSRASSRPKCPVMSSLRADRHHHGRSPTSMVSPQINARALAATLPQREARDAQGHWPHAASRGSRSHRRGNRRTDPERGLKQRF